MDYEYIRKRLPTEASKELRSWVRRELSSELGGGFLIYKAVRAERGATMEELFDNQIHGGKVWAAECTCTECGDTFLTAGGGHSIYLADGEDGSMYTVTPGDEQLPGGLVYELGENDGCTCPMCGSSVRVIHAKKVRGGRTKRVMVAEVQAVAGYAVAVYWMAENEICEYGTSFRMLPKDAFVLGENGGIHRFTKMRSSGSFGHYGILPEWTKTGSNKDTEGCIYSDWGSLNNRKSGVCVYPICANMDGTTGEKTAIEKMVGVRWSTTPVQYWRLWRRYRNVENLVRNGLQSVVASALANGNGYTAGVELCDIFDMQQRTPAGMLGMSKGEFRAFQRLNITWSYREWMAWKIYKDNGGKLEAADFNRYNCMFGYGITAAVELKEPLEKLARYLEKQNMEPRGVHLLKDYRRMMKQVLGRELTAEELWPRRLNDAHDRAAAMVVTQENEAKAKEYDAGFQKQRERLAGLEWTDGELVMVLPKTNAELVREGAVLRHCVGGYGNRHISGKDTIFFVRHYRRPERPYYTLDINTAVSEPYRVQLHGYGNERHGEHKEHRHNIKKKVLDFCERWEKEILMPWAKSQNIKKEQTE